MDSIVAQLKHREIWQVSVQLLVLYGVSVAIFFGVYGANLKAADALRDGVEKGSTAASLTAFTLAAVSNFIGVATLVFLARKLNTTPRLAMVGLGLFLILEKHIRRMRAAPREKRMNIIAAAGVAAGMVGAAFALMRDCPLK